MLRNELIVSGGEIVFRGSENLARRRPEQARLAADRVQLAASFANRLVRLCPWLRIVAISGSTAYGSPRARDDIDFFLVTRQNRLWITLLLAMGLAKIHRMRNTSTPVYCFNRMLDESRCAEAFRKFQDPLFAREALNLRVLDGQPYYRRLLQSASWIEELFPAFYRQALTRWNEKEGARISPGPRLWSIANWIAFAGLAPYAILANLLRNRRLQASDNLEAQFRTVIQPGFFAYESRKFDLLRDTYRRAF
jgi:hypothetical protein